MRFAYRGAAPTKQATEPPIRVIYELRQTGQGEPEGRSTAVMTVQDQDAIAGGAIEENPESGSSHNVPLGTLVLRAGLLPLESIEESLREAIESGRRLGEVLVERGLEERDLARLLAAQNAQ